MVPAAIIAKKRDGHEHSAEEIGAMIAGFVSGEVADYQMSAWAMAIVCRGMTAAETAVLTDCMLHSGSRLPRATDRLRVDKHSTGGLGDSTSLVLAPLMACFDLDVPMLSGRGLGITGGTLDKLESIPGYRTNLTTEEISQQLQRIGCVITGTTPDIAPADRKLYALRDVTATVESVPLITASIMSKKLAESLDALVLDVKFGSGSFMKQITDALQLAESLVSIPLAESTANQSLPGPRNTAIMTAMHQPLGRMVGNACEINEAIEILQGQTTSRLATVTLQLCSELLKATGKARDDAEAENKLLTEIISGRPLKRFQQMVELQHGRFQERLPTAPSQPILALQSGTIHSLDGRGLGQAIIEMGGGRKIMGQKIDHSVGIEMLVQVGQHISAGQPIVNLMCANKSLIPIVSQQIQQSITISDIAPAATPLIVPLN